MQLLGLESQPLPWESGVFSSSTRIKSHLEGLQNLHSLGLTPEFLIQRSWVGFEILHSPSPSTGNAV